MALHHLYLKQIREQVEYDISQYQFSQSFIGTYFDDTEVTFDAIHRYPEFNYYTFVYDAISNQSIRLIPVVMKASQLSGYENGANNGLWNYTQTMSVMNVDTDIVNPDRWELITNGYLGESISLNYRKADLNEKASVPIYTSMIQYIGIRPNKNIREGV